MIERSCADLGKRCKATVVVLISAFTRYGEAIKITSCANHAAEWIWEIRRVYPGHRGIRTEKVDE